MMKKISNYFWVVAAFLTVNMPGAFAAKTTVSNGGICGLVKELKPVIDTLRTLAFVGAAFILMDWAWGFIKAGDVKKDDLQAKGIGMFVGFFLLFGVGFLFHFVGSTGGQEYLGCVEEAFVLPK